MCSAEEKYERFRLFWTDIGGVARGSSVSAAAFEEARVEGVNFANGVAELTVEPGTLEGGRFGPTTGDMVAVPDADSVVPLAWRESEAAVFADLQTIDGAPFPLCARSLLRRVLEAFEAEGYLPMVGAEVEFSLLEEGPDGWRPFTDRSSYDLASIDRAADLVDDWAGAMAAAGWPLGEVHRESQPGQFEVSLEYGDALDVADGVAFFRHAVGAVARRHGLRTTVMPRPYTDEDGNGMHVHLSLWDAECETNLFDGDAIDSGGPVSLSRVAGHFVGGLLAHMPALTAICAPTVNSYKRLVPGRWAPTAVAWGFDNRSTAIRVPPAGGERTRVEHRVPDPSCNPYLAMASTLASGLDGIRNERDPGQPLSTVPEEADCARLPRTLWGALERLAEDELLREALGEELVAEFLKLKRDEFDRSQNAVGEWERRTYRDRF